MREPAIPLLPADLWWSIMQQIECPTILLVLSSTSHELANVLDDEFWDNRLFNAAVAAVHAIAWPRALTIRPMMAEQVLQIAKARTDADVGSARAAFFLVMPHMAEATVQVLSVSAPGLCLVALDRRAYDTTDFVERHPGGSHLMLNKRGRDVSEIFDAFPHSLRAHNLMQTQMLRFDGIAFSGGPGAPRFARAAAPQAWSMLGEARLVCDWVQVGCVARLQHGWQRIQALFEPLALRTKQGDERRAAEDGQQDGAGLRPSAREAIAVRQSHASTEFTIGVCALALGYGLVYAALPAALRPALVYSVQW